MLEDHTIKLVNNEETHEQVVSMVWVIKHIDWSSLLESGNKAEVTTEKHQVYSIVSINFKMPAGAVGHRNKTAWRLYQYEMVW